MTYYLTPDERIANLRQAIADAAEMSHAQLSQIVNGTRANPTVESLARVLTAIGKTMADLDR